MRKPFPGRYQLIAVIIRSNALLFLVEWSPPGVSYELSGRLCALSEALRVIKAIRDCTVPLFGREGHRPCHALAKVLSYPTLRWGIGSTTQKAPEPSKPSVALCPRVIGCSCPTARGLACVLPPENDTTEQDAFTVTDK